MPQQARFSRVTSSHVAATTLAAADKRAESKGFWTWTAVTLAIGFIPVVGVGIAGVLDVFRNGATAKRRKEVLAEHYKNQVAATLGIDPNKVTAHELEMASHVNPMIAQAIAKVKQDEKNANRANVLGTLGAYATLAAFTPAGGVASEGVKLASHLGGTAAGLGISEVLKKNVLQVHDVMEILDEKHKKGEGITPQDILMLRIAQDESLQKAIHKHSSVPFHKMNPAQQQAVISSLPSQYWQEAQESAAKVSSGQMEPQQLLMSGQNDWRAQMDNRRAASAALAQQLG